MGEVRTQSIAAPAGVTTLSIGRNVSWTLIGNVVYAASQWGMLVVIARLGTPEQVGQFALGLAITAPIILLSNLQLRSVVASDARQDYSLAQYVALRTVLTILALVVIFALLLVSGYHGDTALVILAVAAAKAFESMSDICYGELQFGERMDLFARSLAARGGGSLVVMAALLVITPNLPLAVAGLSLVWLGVLVLFDWPAAVRVARAANRRLSLGAVVESLRVEPEALLRLARLSLPLGIVMMLISLNVNIPRYFLEQLHGEYELGIFAALAYVVVAVTMLTQSLGQALTPRLSRLAAAGDMPALRSLLRSLLGLGALLGVATVSFTWLFGEWFLALVYGAEYAAYLPEFLVLMIGAAANILTTLLGCTITAMRAFRQQMLPIAAVTTATTVASWLLVPRYGILGGTAAVLVGNIVNTALLALVFRSLVQQYASVERNT